MLNQLLPSPFQPRIFLYMLFPACRYRQYCSEPIVKGCSSEVQDRPYPFLDQKVALWPDMSKGKQKHLLLLSSKEKLLSVLFRWSKLFMR